MKLSILQAMKKKKVKMINRNKKNYIKNWYGTIQKVRTLEYRIIVDKEIQDTEQKEFAIDEEGQELNFREDNILSESEEENSIFWRKKTRWC